MALGDTDNRLSELGKAVTALAQAVRLSNESLSEPNPEAEEKVGLAFSHLQNFEQKQARIDRGE